VKLRSKTLLVLTGVGLFPLIVLGWLSFGANRDELEQTVGAAHLSTAVAAARGCERWVAQSLDALRASLASLPLEELSPSETATVLRIPYRQLGALEAVALLDEKGRAVAPPVHEPKPGAKALTEAELDEFGRHVPLSFALAAGAAIGHPWRAGNEARLAVALRLGDPARVPKVAAAQLSLLQLDRQLAELAQDGVQAWLVDEAGAFVAGQQKLPPSPAERELAQDALGRPQVRELVRADGARWLVAYAPVGELGWGVLVAQPSAHALRPAERVRRYTIYWGAITLCLVLLLGLLLSRELTAPLGGLTHAAAALTAGRYDERAPVETGDELGALGEAFNHMAAEVRRRDQEIRGWNQELQARVDRAAKELEEARDQVARTRRLAALGSLGAGVAHELNNPLTAISGAAVLLSLQLGPGSPQAPLLKTLEEQTRRVTKIAAGLRKLADEERTAAGRRFALPGPVGAALEARKAELERRGVELDYQCAPGLPDVQGDAAQLEELTGQLVQNALQAMPLGGRLSVRLSDVGGEALRLTVQDTGKGIAPKLRERIFDPFFTTKDEPGAVGLGLSIAHAIALAHHGRLTVESAEGQGATFTVLLPAAGAAAHLA
jgi:two-component system, NtrC family, sensor kinase